MIGLLQRVSEARVMVEGRCTLSSYVTGQSPNNAGVCSPPSAVRWQEGPDGVQSRLNSVALQCQWQPPGHRSR